MGILELGRRQVAQAGVAPAQVEVANVPAHRWLNFTLDPEFGDVNSLLLQTPVAALGERVVPALAPAAVRTRQPCAGDPRWARRVANAVLILRVLMLQCRRVTGESLERSGSFLA